MDTSTKAKAEKAGTLKGVAFYTPTVLRLLYDRLVLGLYFSYAWRCPTKTEPIPFFNANSFPTEHTNGPSTDSSPPRALLDIGVGTGYFLKHSPLTSINHLTLVDLNPTCLDAAAARARKAHPSITCSTVYADFLAPDGLSASSVGEAKFDAISVMLLLHCLPGPPSRKAAALIRLRGLLKKDGGVLFGATILGQGVTHNVFGRFLMWLHNRRGIFGNREDAAKSFVEPLEEALEDVRWRLVGRVLLFEARGPVV
ncbi:hypothetical protein SLS56_002777 [Neofusicoccum ribis]|uniref:Methyltransferase type 12 domain-containing protein n=1 Tax=Neofusicoccum ribis TaxID=45134 RepID=A0ABR3T246_9PEZI